MLLLFVVVVVVVFLVAQDITHTHEHICLMFVCLFVCV